MKLKEGVSLVGLQLPMRKVLIAADKIWALYGKELVITSTLDGIHKPGSLHYYGYAIDLRTNYFLPEHQTAVALELQGQLGSDYTVVIHSTHIHVEYKKILSTL